MHLSSFRVSHIARLLILRLFHQIFPTDDYLLVHYVPVRNHVRPNTRSWQNEQRAQIVLTTLPGGLLNHVVWGPVAVRPGGTPPTVVDTAHFVHVYGRMAAEVLRIHANYMTNQGSFTGFTMADLDSIVAELRFG